MGKSAVNILPRAPSGTAVDGHTAMIPAGDGSSDHYPRQVCSSKCPVSEALNCLDGADHHRTEITEYPSSPLRKPSAGGAYNLLPV